MAVNNKLVPQNEAQKQPFSVIINGAGYQKLINNTLRDPKTAGRFVAGVVSAVQTTPTLQECDPNSIIAAALLGESLGLSPSPQLGHYYMVPYDDKKRGKIAQFQLGYKAYIQLAERSGNYKKINVLSIKEGELIKYDPLNEDIEVNIIEDDEERENTPTIGYYAMFEYHNGFRKAIYWSKKKMLLHADKYSAAFSLNGTKGKYPKVSFADYEAGNYDPSTAWLYSSFWYKNFDQMAHKTMLRQLISKWGIMSIEMQKAFEGDMAAVNTDGTFDYVDNQPDKPDFAPGPEKVIDVETGEIKDESGLSEAEQAEILAAEAAEAQQSAEDDFFNQN